MISEDFEKIVNRAITLHKKGFYEAAQEWYESALSIQPQNSHLLRLYGVSFFQLGDFEKAMKLYYYSIAVQPNNSDTWRHLGIVLKETGKYQEAIEAYQKSITYRRNNPEAFRNLGNVLADLNRNDEAVVAYQEALRLKPDYAEAYTNLGVIYEKQEKIDDAINTHNKALTFLPYFAPAHNNLGQALLRKGLFKTAIKSFRKAIKFNPNYAIGWSNLGIALSALNKVSDAEEALTKACILDVKSIPCKRNLAIFCQQIGQYDKALLIYEELVKLQPEKIDPYFNIADLYNAKGDYKLALDALRNGVLKKPKDSNAHLALSINLLKHGNYEEGFAEYEWRRRNNYKNREYENSVEWQGEDLYGKTILLYPEQGLGDMIQFIRFAEVLHNMGAKVLVETYACLKKVFSLSFPHLTIFSPEVTTIHEFHYYSPLMSIPNKLKLSINQIPTNAYLRPTSEKVEKWKSFLRKGTLNIGIVWQGNPQGEIDRGRSIPLHFFKVLAKIKNVQLYSMQKNFGLDQLDELAEELNIIKLPEDFDAGEDAFIDTLALMNNLDLVITSDTSIAHIGGACGCPTWVVLKHNPDWRWGMSNIKSFWYDSIRLFRQKKIGDWSSVFSEISEAVKMKALM